MTASVVRPRASATRGDHRIRGENGLGPLPVGQMDATFRCPVRYIRSLEYRSGGKARALPPVSSENYEAASRNSWISPLSEVVSVREVSHSYI